MAKIEENSRKIIQRLKSEGWSQLRVHGSHHVFGHPKVMHVVVVVHPEKDLPLGTARRIAKDAGWI